MKMEDLKYTIGGLMLAVDSYFYDDFIYFWKHDEEKGKITKACLSQWYPSTFIVDGVTYNCAEQYMMAEKARIFGDEVIRAKILATSDPSAIKKLGRLVSNFDAEVWDEGSLGTEGMEEWINQGHEYATQVNKLLPKDIDLYYGYWHQFGDGKWRFCKAYLSKDRK